MSTKHPLPNVSTISPDSADIECDRSKKSNSAIKFSYNLYSRNMYTRKMAHTSNPYSQSELVDESESDDNSEDDSVEDDVEDSVMEDSEEEDDDNDSFIEDEIKDEEDEIETHSSPEEDICESVSDISDLGDEESHHTVKRKMGIFDTKESIQREKRRLKKTSLWKDFIVESQNDTNLTLNPKWTPVDPSQPSAIPSITYLCKACPKFSNPRRSVAYTHLARKHTVPMNTCIACPKQFYFPAELRRHMRRRHRHLLSEDCQKFKCEQCKEGFPSVIALKMHMRSHMDRANRHCIFCITCKETFNTREALKIHREDVHGELPMKYPCRYCSSVFSRKFVLRDHENNHLGVFPYVCYHPGCDRKYAINASFRNHLKAEHDPTSRFKCDTCGKMFKRRVGYLTHMMIHKGTRNFKCQFCEKRFTQVSAQKRHERIHLGDKPFACPICPFRTGDTSILRRHKHKHERQKTRNEAKAAAGVTSRPMSSAARRNSKEAKVATEVTSKVISFAAGITSRALSSATVIPTSGWSSTCNAKGTNNQEEGSPSNSTSDDTSRPGADRWIPWGMKVAIERAKVDHLRKKKSAVVITLGSPDAEAVAAKTTNLQTKQLKLQPSVSSSAFQQQPQSQLTTPPPSSFSTSIYVATGTSAASAASADALDKHVTDLDIDPTEAEPPVLPIIVHPLSLAISAGHQTLPAIATLQSAKVRTNLTALQIQRDHPGGSDPSLTSSATPSRPTVQYRLVPRPLNHTFPTTSGGVQLTRQLRQSVSPIVVRRNATFLPPPASLSSISTGHQQLQLSTTPTVIQQVVVSQHEAQSPNSLIYVVDPNTGLTTVQKLHSQDSPVPSNEPPTLPLSEFYLPAPGTNQTSVQRELFHVLRPTKELPNDDCPVISIKENF